MYLRITILFLGIITLSCNSSADQPKESITSIARDTSDYDTISLSGDSLEIISNVDKRYSFLKAGSDSVPLLFFINSQTYLGETRRLYIPQIGKVIAVENYASGATGLMASIVHVTIIPVNNYRAPLFYNSFYKGIDAIKIDSVKNTAQVEIIVHENFDDQNNDLCCLYTFTIDAKGIANTPTSVRPIIFKGFDKAFKKGEHECEELKSPFVYTPD